MYGFLILLMTLCCAFFSNCAAQSNDNKGDDDNLPTWKCKDDGRYQCQSFLLARFWYYESRIDGKPITWDNPPIAVFTRHQMLRGKPVDFQIRLRYRFYDPQNRVPPPKDWVFDEKFMPKRDSKWILFLSSADNNKVYETFKGPSGCVEATENELNAVYRYLEEKFGAL